jgi:hypothetical protein
MKRRRVGPVHRSGRRAAGLKVRMALFEPIFAALNEAGIRYVVVGGLAVVLHGHARLTADIDLVIDLEPEHVRRTLALLSRLGFRARLPVQADLFADPAVRASWVRERGMRVFPLYDPADPLRVLDLFSEHPIDFESLWAGSMQIPVQGTTIRVASIPDLIRLKRIAGRPQDRADIEALERLLHRRGDPADG